MREQSMGDLLWGDQKQYVSQLVEAATEIDAREAFDALMDAVREREQGIHIRGAVDHLRGALQRIFEAECKRQAMFTERARQCAEAQHRAATCDRLAATVQRAIDRLGEVVKEAPAAMPEGFAVKLQELSAALKLLMLPVPEAIEQYKADAKKLAKELEANPIPASWPTRWRAFADGVSDD